MKKPLKIALGLFTFWPFLYFILFFVFFFSLASEAEQAHGAQPPDFFFVFFGLHIGTMLVIFALLIIYIINLFSNECIPTDKKVLWAVVLFLGNMLAFPFYWYLYIWKEPKPLPLPDSELEGGHIYCQKCGTRQDYNLYKCVSCGHLLHPLHPAKPSGCLDYNSVGSVIPYKNKKALLSYYLAVFALIPVAGAVLGGIALFLGLKGREFAIQHPEAKGKGHAWIGISLGGTLFLFNWVGLSVLFFYFKNL